MIDSDITATNLKYSLRQTREEKNGISLKEIAEIICEIFDPAEVKMLIKNLKEIKI